MATRKRGFKDPSTEVNLIDRNFSDRNHPIHNAQVMQAAVHTTESHNRPGGSDRYAIRAWFNNSQSQASSHNIIDADGESLKVVARSKKAWTIGAANSFTVNYELIGHAADAEVAWRKRMPELKKLAQHLAYDHRTLGIPLQKGRVERRGSVLVATRKGVIRHSDVTKAGFGSHSDPGKGFPLRFVILMARWYAKHGWYAGPAK